MVKGGVAVPLAIFMSVIVYAGSAQVASLPLIAAGAPMWVIWVTTLCVSLRFLAFGYHYRPYFMHLPRGRRLALSFLMGDANFALFIRRFPEHIDGVPYERYFLGSALTIFVVWQLSIVTGILAGHGIPQSWGLGFAGTMALLALTCTQLKDRTNLLAAVVSVVVAVATYALPMKLNIVAAVAAAVLVCVVVNRWRPKQPKVAR